MAHYNEMIYSGTGVPREINPKRYNFSGNFIGDPSGTTIDEQMMGVIRPYVDPAAAKLSESAHLSLL